MDLMHILTKIIQCIIKQLTIALGVFKEELERGFKLDMKCSIF